MDWSHRLHTTISYKTGASISDGNITYSSLSTAAARVEQYPAVVKGTGGEEHVTSHRMASQTDIPVEARVWIDSTQTGDDTKALRILRKEEAYLLDNSYTLYVYTLGR